MSRFSTALVAVFLALVLTTPVFAATSGLIRGKVTVDGKPAPRATVTLQGEGSSFQTTTDAQGDYVFPQVPFGSYRVIAQVKGTNEIQVLVNVASGTVATVNLPLSTHLAQIAHTTVTAHAGPQANPPSVNQLGPTQIETSPVNNSLNRLLETLPGVVQFSYNEPVINGFHGVAYNIDGAPLPLATTSNFAEIIDPKVIDSIELLTGAIPAEYGGDRMGGVVNLISNRPNDIPQGTYGTITGGFGNQGQGIGEFDVESRYGPSEFSQRQHPNDRSRARRAHLHSDQRRQLEQRSVFSRHYATRSAQLAGVRLFQSVLAVPDSDQYGCEQSTRPGRGCTRHARHAARVRPFCESQLDGSLQRR